MQKNKSIIYQRKKLTKVGMTYHFCSCSDCNTHKQRLKCKYILTRNTFDCNQFNVYSAHIKRGHRKR